MQGFQRCRNRSRRFCDRCQRFRFPCRNEPAVLRFHILFMRQPFKNIPRVKIHFTGGIDHEPCHEMNFPSKTWAHFIIFFRRSAKCVHRGDYWWYTIVCRLTNRQKGMCTLTVLCCVGAHLPSLGFKPAFCIQQLTWLLRGLQFPFSGLETRHTLRLDRLCAGWYVQHLTHIGVPVAARNRTNCFPRSDMG